jgi:hypothetical protein
MIIARDEAAAGLTASLHGKQAVRQHFNPLYRGGKHHLAAMTGEMPFKRHHVAVTVQHAR